VFKYFDHVYVDSFKLIKLDVLETLPLEVQDPNLKFKPCPPQNEKRSFMEHMYCAKFMMKKLVTTFWRSWELRNHLWAP
jgi:hypothetical protein